jgi:threonine dehydrogenase-like Zn-dependent dehydrogenase
VFAADPVPEKRERALKLGADFSLDPLAPDFAEKLRSMTPNPDSAIFKGDQARGVKVAIEVTGRGSALDSVLDAMAFMGRVALLGCTRSSNFTIDYYHKVHGRGVTLIGAHTWARPGHESYPGHFTHRDDATAFLRLLSLGRISLDGFVDEVHSVSDAPEVYARLGAGGAFPVVQFNWASRT